MKFLLWIIIGVAIVMWVIRSGKSSPSGKSAASAAGPERTSESMLQCAHCGIHLPASESIAGSSGAVFCSEEHRLKHARS